MIFDVILSPISQICGLASSKNAKTKVRAKSSFGSSPSKPSPTAHTLSALKTRIADQERPTNCQKDLHDLVHNGSVAFQICKIHTHNIQQRRREILPAFQSEPIGPFEKALKNKLKQRGHLLCAGALTSLRRQSGKAAEERCNIGDKSADAVNNGPCDPNALEPIPRLIGLMLII